MQYKGKLSTLQGDLLRNSEIRKELKVLAVAVDVWYVVSVTNVLVLCRRSERCSPQRSVFSHKYLPCLRVYPYNVLQMGETRGRVWTIERELRFFLTQAADDKPSASVRPDVSTLWAFYSHARVFLTCSWTGSKRNDVWTAIWNSSWKSSRINKKNLLHWKKRMLLSYCSHFGPSLLLLFFRIGASFEEKRALLLRLEEHQMSLVELMLNFQRQAIFHARDTITIAGV